MAAGRPARIRRGLGAEYADWEARIRDFSNAEFTVGYCGTPPLLGESGVAIPTWPLGLNYSIILHFEHVHEVHAIERCGDFLLQSLVDIVLCIMS